MRVIVSIVLALSLLTGCTAMPDALKPYVDKVTSLIEKLPAPDKPTDFDPFGEK